MTAVIGMLNKNGVAIAADNAVTRNRWKECKFIRNSNKILRVSNVVPVSVMITGNTDFLKNPWEIIIKNYCKDRGTIRFPKVEVLMTDLIDYLLSTDSLWEVEYEYHLLCQQLDSFMDMFIKNMACDAKEVDVSGNLKHPGLFIKEALKSLKEIQKLYAFDDVNIGFRKYSITKFKDFFDSYLMGNLNASSVLWISEIKRAIRNQMDEIGDELWESLYTYLTHLKGDWSATLIFTGYGSEETYPSLIAIKINEGFDRHINWGIVKKVNIDDETPSAICPFSRNDVIKTLLAGASVQWLAMMDHDLDSLYKPMELLLPRYTNENPDENGEADQQTDSTDSMDIPDLSAISHSNLTMRRRKTITKIINENHYSWLEDMEDYDVRSMAELARTLINLTGLHRKLITQREVVGGDVNLAVITKNDGFIWLGGKT